MDVAPGWKSVRSTIGGCCKASRGPSRRGIIWEIFGKINGGNFSISKRSETLGGSCSIRGVSTFRQSRTSSLSDEGACEAGSTASTVLFGHSYNPSDYEVSQAHGGFRQISGHEEIVASIYSRSVYCGWRASDQRLYCFGSWTWKWLSPSQGACQLGVRLRRSDFS